MSCSCSHTPRPRTFAVVAPSGTGKTTLSQRHPSAFRDVDDALGMSTAAERTRLRALRTGRDTDWTAYNRVWYPIVDRWLATPSISDRVVLVHHPDLARHLRLPVAAYVYVHRHVALARVAARPAGETEVAAASWDSVWRVGVFELATRRALGQIVSGEAPVYFVARRLLRACGVSPTVLALDEEVARV